MISMLVSYFFNMLTGFGNSESCQLKLIATPRGDFLGKESKL